MITIWRLASVTKWDHWCPGNTALGAGRRHPRYCLAVTTINRIDITFQVVIVCSDKVLCTHLTLHFNCQHHCGASSFEWKQIILFRIFETLTQSINIDLCCVYSVKPIDWLEMPWRVKFMLHDDVLRQKPILVLHVYINREWDCETASRTLMFHQADWTNSVFCKLFEKWENFTTLVLNENSTLRKVRCCVLWRICLKAELI